MTAMPIRVAGNFTTMLGARLSKWTPCSSIRSGVRKKVGLVCIERRPLRPPWRAKAASSSFAPRRDISSTIAQPSSTSVHVACSAASSWTRSRQWPGSFFQTSMTMVGLAVAPTAPKAMAYSSSSTAHESFQISVGVVATGAGGGAVAPAAGGGVGEPLPETIAVGSQPREPRDERAEPARRVVVQRGKPVEDRGVVGRVGVIVEDRLAGALLELPGRDDLLRALVEGDEPVQRGLGVRAPPALPVGDPQPASSRRALVGQPEGAAHAFGQAVRQEAVEERGDLLG